MEPLENTAEPQVATPRGVSPPPGAKLAAPQAGAASGQLLLQEPPAEMAAPQPVAQHADMGGQEHALVASRKRQVTWADEPPAKRVPPPAQQAGVLP